MTIVFHGISPRHVQHTVENGAQYSDDDQSDSDSDGAFGRISITDDGRCSLQDDHSRTWLPRPVRIYGSHGGTRFHSTVIVKSSFHCRRYLTKSSERGAITTYFV